MTPPPVRTVTALAQLGPRAQCHYVRSHETPDAAAAEYERKFGHAPAYVTVLVPQQWLYMPVTAAEASRERR